MSRLDDIMKTHLIAYERMNGSGGLINNISSAKSELKFLFKEIIGEDEPDPKLFGCCDNEGGLLCFKESKQRAANKVKAELRQKVNEL